MTCCGARRDTSGQGYSGLRLTERLTETKQFIPLSGWLTYVASFNTSGIGNNSVPTNIFGCIKSLILFLPNILSGA